MASVCFQKALAQSQVSAETSDTAGALLFLLASVGAAVAADGSDDVLPNPFSEIRRRVVAACGGKRSLLFQEVERLLASLEKK
jgi:hypothetical protein